LQPDPLAAVLVQAHLPGDGQRQRGRAPLVIARARVAQFDDRAHRLHGVLEGAGEMLRGTIDDPVVAAACERVLVTSPRSLD